MSRIGSSFTFVVRWSIGCHLYCFSNIVSNIFDNLHCHSFNTFIFSSYLFVSIYNYRILRYILPNSTTLNRSVMSSIYLLSNMFSMPNSFNFLLNCLSHHINKISAILSIDWSPILPLSYSTYNLPANS